MGASEYIPCELTTVTLRVKDPDFKYLGLLLYAVADNGKETKVGQWNIPPSKAPMFWTPPMCKGRAIMHANAGVKHFVHKFYYQTPPAGTGKIIFRALIKHGETNGGSFFWPGMED